MPFESFRERERVQDAVDEVDAIIAGLAFDAQALRTTLRLKEAPNPERIQRMINKLARLQIALNGCMVETPEYQVSQR